MNPKLATSSEPILAVTWRILAAITRRSKWGAVDGDRRLRIMDIFVSGTSSSMECPHGCGSLECLMFVSAILFNQKYHGGSWLRNCRKQKGQKDVGLVFHSLLQFALGMNLRHISNSPFLKQSNSDFMMCTSLAQKW